MKRTNLILALTLLLMVNLALISAANSSQLDVSVSVSEETVPPVTPPSTGGGGGGTTTVTGDEFKVESTLYQISIVQGETKTDTIKLTNLKSSSKTLTISISDELKDIVQIESPVTLSSKEAKTVLITFNPLKKAAPGMYLGVINVTDEKENLIQVLVGIEVESPGALLDVIIDLPQEKELFKAGEKLLAEIELFNLGTIPASVDIEYVIKDAYGNIVLGEKQTLQVVGNLKLNKEFMLPKDLISGKYVIYVTAKYNGKTALASKWFSVSNEFAKVKSLIAMSLFTIVICYIIFMSIKKAYFIKKRSTSKRKAIIVSGYSKKR